MSGWKEYLSFTKRERTGVVTLVILIIMTMIAPGLYHGEELGSGDFSIEEFGEYHRSQGSEAPGDINPKAHSDEWKDPSKSSFPDFLSENEAVSDPTPAAIKRTGVAINRPGYLPGPGRENGPMEEDGSNHATNLLFEFDPNTLLAHDWARLGIDGSIIRTIERFRGKGGRFRKAEDIGRIYGMNEEVYRRLLPYVRIAQDNRNPKWVKSNEQSGKYDLKRERGRIYPEYPNRYHRASGDLFARVIDINKSDTAAFIALPGIGSRLASRIVLFRDRLGGFYNITQIREVYGLPDSVYQLISPRFSCDSLSIRKIDINREEAEILQKHPYIKWQMANAIVNYRRQHGVFNSVEELKNIHIVDQDMLEKLMPYLSFGDGRK